MLSSFPIVHIVISFSSFLIFESGRGTMKGAKSDLFLTRFLVNRLHQGIPRFHAFHRLHLNAQKI